MESSVYLKNQQNLNINLKNGKHLGEFGLRGIHVFECNTY